jgi:hypothetical protein
MWTGIVLSKIVTTGEGGFLVNQVKKLCVLLRTWWGGGGVYYFLTSCVTIRF